MKLEELRARVKELNLKPGDKIEVRARIFVVKKSKTPWNWHLVEAEFVEFNAVSGSLVYKHVNQEGYKTLSSIYYGRILELKLSSTNNPAQTECEAFLRHYNLTPQSGFVQWFESKHHNDMNDYSFEELQRHYEAWRYFVVSEN